MKWSCLSEIWGERPSCGYEFPKWGCFICSRWSHLPFSVHFQTMMCSQTQTVTHKETNEGAHTPPPIHLSILGIQFSPLVLLRSSKWMIKSTMRFKSSGMCGYCQRLVRQPGGSRVPRREKISPPLPSLKSTFIGINLSSTGQENILRPAVVIPASKLIRSSRTLQRFLSSLWGGNTSHRTCWDSSWSTELQY